MAADPGSSRTEDLYATLGVAPDATERQIREAYRSVARQLHPDRRPGDPGAEERFKRVTAAYEVLADPGRRAAYDRARRYGSAPGAAAAGHRRAGAKGPVTIPVQHVEHAAGDYLRDVRGGASRRSARFGSGRARPTRAVRVEATVPFERAVLGGAVTVGVPGAGQQIEVQLPPGVHDGQTLRVPDAGPSGPVEVEVVVRVRPHPRLGRQGDDLTVTLPITYPQAVLGADVPVRLLGDERITVRVPPGTPSGQVLRVRGRGVATAGGTRRGDLLVTVEIAVPRRVGDAERRAIQALADVMEIERRDRPE